MKCQIGSATQVQRYEKRLLAIDAEAEATFPRVHRDTIKQFEVGVGLCRACASEAQKQPAPKSRAFVELIDSARGDGLEYRGESFEHFLRLYDEFIQYREDSKKYRQEGVKKWRDGIVKIAERK